MLQGQTPAPEPPAAVAIAFEKVRSADWLPAWKDASIAKVHLAVQSKDQLYRLPLGPVWKAEIRSGEHSVGYFILEAEPPHRWVEFGVDAETPFLNQPGQCQGIENVPNLQQFPVPGQNADRVASGCVPTSGANVVGFWAAHGFPQWLESPFHTQDLQNATLRLRKRMAMVEFRDKAGYTDDGIPLTGATMAELAAALRKDAAEYGVKILVHNRAFSPEVYRTQIAAGRPTLLGCGVRLPHKPHLSWGHSVTGIGWTAFEDEFFVMLRDNFYPTRNPNAVRWVRADAFSELITLTPK
jgi:hypothetical protein